MSERKYQLFQAMRKETWTLVNFLHVQVSEIFMTCMLIIVAWKKKHGEILQYTNKPGYCGIIDSEQLSIDWLQGPPDLENNIGIHGMQMQQNM